MLRRIDRWLYRHFPVLARRGGVWGLLIAVAGMVVVWLLKGL